MLNGYKNGDDEGECTSVGKQGAAIIGYGIVKRIEVEIRRKIIQSNNTKTNTNIITIDKKVVERRKNHKVQRENKNNEISNKLISWKR